MAAGAYPGFSSMRWLQVFLLPPEGDDSQSQVTALNLLSFPTIRQYPFKHLGGERHCESKVACPRTKHDVPGQDSNPDHSLRSGAH